MLSPQYTVSPARSPSPAAEAETLPPEPHHASVPTIPGHKAHHELAQMLRHEVARLLGRRESNFPGAQPVSFCRDHLEELKRRDYFLCEKSDGIRCLLYFTQDEHNREIHYLIDRKNDYYFVQGLHFPKQNDSSFQSFHKETIIDGELVLDNIGHGKKQLRYLVFDCLTLDNLNIMERTLDKRLAYFRDWVYNPYKELCRKFPEEVPYFPFQLEFKKMEVSYGIEMMFRDVLPNLPHGNDGLIFTCRESPYKFGTDPKILKWKPADENSIDFRLKLEFPVLSREELEEDGESDADPAQPFLDFDSKPTFNLTVYMGSEEYEKWAEMYVTDAEWDQFKAMGQPLDEEIVECFLDTEKHWKFMKFRKDKKYANHISTVKSVIQSIEDAVGEDDLVRAAKGIKDAWKARNAPPVKK